MPNLRHRFICAAANYCETTVELLPSKSGVETGVPMSPSLKQDCVRAVRQHTVTIADFFICRRSGWLFDFVCVQVLTWREHPQDLDLHCLTSNCHVYVCNLSHMSIRAREVRGTCRISSDAASAGFTKAATASMAALSWRRT